LTDVESPEVVSRSARMTSALGVTAQLVSSVTNFVAMLLTAKSGSTSEFGTVAVAFSFYLIVLAVERAVVAEPLLIRHQLDGQQFQSRVASWAALTLSVPGAIVVAGIGLLAGSDALVPIVVLAACLPLLIWQDVQRFQQLAMRRPERVIVYDGAWLLLFIIGYVSFGAGARGPHMVWALWCVSGAVVGLGLLCRHPLPTRIRQGVTWLKGHRDLSFPLLADSATAAITGNVTMILLVTLSGKSATGTVRAATSLFGVLTVMYLGLYSALIGFAQRSPEARRRVEVWSTAIIELAAVSITLIFIAIPDRVGRFLLGATWLPVHAVLPYYGFATAMSVASTGAQISLRSQERSPAILRARLVSSPAALVLPLVGAALDDARGFCIGLGVSSALTAVLLWRSTRKSPRVLRTTLPSSAHE
jgi:hypothetical protein